MDWHHWGDDVPGTSKKLAKGSLAEDFYIVLIMALARRLHQRGSSCYLRRWRLGLTELRLLMALGKQDKVPSARWPRSPMSTRQPRAAGLGTWSGAA